jgi:hypothetical protein
MDLTGVGSLADFAGKILDRLSPDPTVKAQQQLELAKMTQNGELAQLAADTDIIKGQLAINQEEAKNASIFVSGGRPFVIWICACALGYATILEPVARFVATVIYHYSGAFPAIDTMLTFQVLGGLLGLSGMRSWEKGKGVASR